MAGLDHSTSRKLIDDLIAITSPDNTRERTNGIVTRIDKDGTIWARLSGASSDTPCTKSAVSVKVGDSVGVRVSGKRAIIDANYTAPSTDDSTANKALETGSSAERVANRARKLSEDAVESAGRAADAAADAEQSATEASESARQAFSYLLDVEDDWEAIEEYREEAGLTVAEIAELAEEAEESASQAAADAADAKSSAYSASEYAARALGHLGTVESVAETLTWITEHGTMTKTSDTEPDPTHVYFVADDDGDYTVGTKQVYRHTTDVAIDPDKTYYELVYSYALTQDTSVVEGKTYYVLVEGEYVEVENPVDEDIATYYERSESYEEVDDPIAADLPTYYELVSVPAKYSIVIAPDADEMESYYELSIDESLQNYVGTHMALDGEGLWLMPAGSGGSRILISTGQGEYDAGTHIFDGISGSPVAYYGEETVIGDPLGFHIIITPNTVDGVSGLIGFYYGPNRISYISSTQLVIPNAVVVESLSVGTNWMWVTSSNGNLNLKWIGSV